MRNPFRTRPRRAAVLGAGPAGMFAAHAFLSAGWEVVIYSRKRMSDMFGAQYLHAPILGLPQSQTSITYALVGTVEGYAEKVYGPDSGVRVSPEDLVGEHKAWDIRAAYREAYARYADAIEATDIDPMWMAARFGGTEIGRSWGAVVSSIPAPALCFNSGHAFSSRTAYAAGDAPERDIWCPISTTPDTVTCDGTADRAWYRVSSVFGHTTAEWPARRKPPFTGVAEVSKPIANTCTCWPTVVRIGRYGAWTKGILAHQAYDTAAWLAEQRG